MYKIDVTQVKPISLLPREYNKLIKVVKDKGEVVFMKGNKPHVVLVDFDYWKKLMEREKRREDEDGLKAIGASEQEYKEGKARRLGSLTDLWVEK